MTANDEKKKWLVPYEITVVGTNEKLSITAGTVNRLINPNANIEECMIFLSMCRSLGANPFLKDLHLVKYSKDQHDPASFVGGIGFFEKKAQTNPKFKGYGKTVYLNDKGEWKDIFIAKKFGFGLYPVAARAFCYVEGFAEVQQRTATWDECVGKKRDGNVNASWKKQPGVMIEKVAKVRLLRGIFSAELAGLYSIDELGSEAMNQHTEDNPKGLTEGTTSFSNYDEPTEAVEAEIVDDVPEELETPKNEEKPKNKEKDKKTKKEPEKEETQPEQDSQESSSEELFPE